MHVTGPGHGCRMPGVTAVPPLLQPLPPPPGWHAGPSGSTRPPSARAFDRSACVTWFQAGRHVGALPARLVECAQAGRPRSPTSWGADEQLGKRAAVQAAGRRGSGAGGGRRLRAQPAVCGDAGARDGAARRPVCRRHADPCHPGQVWEQITHSMCTAHLLNHTPEAAAVSTSSQPRRCAPSLPAAAPSCPCPLPSPAWGWSPGSSS